MNKKDKKMPKDKKVWKTVGVEAELLAKLEEEAAKSFRSAQSMLCHILTERYAPK